MPAPISDERRRRLLKLHFDEGYSINQASKIAGVSYSWARAACQGFQSASERDKVHKSDREREKALIDRATILQRPLRREELGDRALQGLEDFGFFRSTYLGRVASPWHEEAALTIVEALKSPNKDFVVINVAPGAGKSTMLHDVAAWMTVRNRGLRGVFGSRTYPNAARATRRLRKTLERNKIARPSDEDLAHGMAVEPTAILSLDYGLFKPPVRSDLWRSEEFVVMQDDDVPIDEKEPTWSAVGMDTGFLGNRYDVIFWDDVVDGSTVKSLEAMEKQRAWWDDEAESRLEPRGAMFLVGQRFAANDLYRYCLDKKVPLDDDDDLSDEELDAAQDDQPGLYRHIVYKAHDESKCEKQHSRDSAPWPEGCLLDPKRVSWRDIRGKNPRTFAIQYQQEDANPEDVLVRPIWVTGGTDPDTGKFHRGCRDMDRGVMELPEGLVPPFVSYATVDPSPTKWWAVQHWVFTPKAANQLWLMDSLKLRMGGNDLLDFNPDTNRWTGVMEEWQQRSAIKGFKIQHWVVEINAAQRFLLQYNHVLRWQSNHAVNLMPHTTTLHKSDPELGLDMVKEWWASGRIRLPYRGLSDRAASNNLVNEVTRYPNAGLDDQVLSHWFGISNLQRMTPASQEAVVLPRPSFVTDIHDYRAQRSLA